MYLVNNTFLNLEFVQFLHRWCTKRNPLFCDSRIFSKQNIFILYLQNTKWRVQTPQRQLAIGLHGHTPPDYQIVIWIPEEHTISEKRDGEGTDMCHIYGSNASGRDIKDRLYMTVMMEFFKIYTGFKKIYLPATSVNILHDLMSS